jgi:unsaturated chondroitin disaccharide hydrolase
LYELSGKREYHDAASEIFKSLSKDYIADNSDGILKHGCFHKPANLGVNECLIWGDYYFTESFIYKDKKKMYRKWS